LLGAAAVVVALAARTELRAGPDHEFWLTGAARWTMPEGWDGEVTMQEKLRHDARKAYDYEGEVNFSHVLRSAWSGSFGYTHVETINGVRWLREDRLNGALVWRGRLAGWTLAVRERLEYRDREVVRDGWRNRLRAVVGVPMPKGSASKPYASAEAFYDQVARHWNQTRVFAGNVIACSPACTIDLFAGWRGDYKAARWRQTPLVGVKVSLKI